MKERRKIKADGEKREIRQVKFFSRENANAPGLSEVAMNLLSGAVQRKTQKPKSRSAQEHRTDRRGCLCGGGGIRALQGTVEVVREKLDSPVVH